jgi:hypothetical protein
MVALRLEAALIENLQVKRGPVDPVVMREHAREAKLLRDAPAARDRSPSDPGDAQATMDEIPRCRVTEGDGSSKKEKRMNVGISIGGIILIIILVILLT